MFLKRALFAFINMPIRNCPIYSYPYNKDTLILLIKIINPHNSEFLKTWEFLSEFILKIDYPK